MNRDREMMYEQKLKEEQSPGHEGAVGQLLEMKVDHIETRAKQKFILP
jgi:hypothetical protein